MTLGIVEETVSNEQLAQEAQDSQAPTPEPTAKKIRKTKKEATPEEIAAKAAKEQEKAAKKAAKEAAKANKQPRQTMKDLFIKVLVKAADSGLRPGTGRFQFLEAAESATKVSDLVGKEFTVGDNTVKLGANNIQGMYSRGHVALSKDGEVWERIQTTVVTE